VRPSAWLVSYRLEGGRTQTSVWDNIGDARSVEEMKREDGFVDVTRIGLYTAKDAALLWAERMEAEAHSVGELSKKFPHSALRFHWQKKVEWFLRAARWLRSRAERDEG
jgi:hypothetical protein